MNTNLLANFGASTLGGALAGGMIVAGFVNLQDTTPGTPQTGHINVTGTVRAGNVGVGVAPASHRVQVNATGALGGVRGDAVSGTGVLGTSNVTGGNFIARATGGRGVVGDAQATTGVTFGGVFATRTAGNGAGVYARAIGVNNTGTGLIAENTSDTGKAFLARNTATNNSLEAGTPNDSLVTNGSIPRHNYVANTPASMVPIAYGHVQANGTVISGSGNFTVTRVSTGKYDVDVAGVLSPTSMVFVATSSDGAGKELCTVAIPTTGDRRVQVFDFGSNAFTDSEHYFVAYRAAGLLEPPAGLARPDMGSAKDLEDWERRDPAAFQRWLRAYQAWERDTLATEPAPPPVTP